MEHRTVPAQLVGIIPSTLLTIQAITCDDDAIRIEYTLDPPFPAVHEWPGDLGWQMMDWEITAKDDVGTEYWPGGGALGTDRGVRSLQPTLPRNAHRLTIAIRPYNRARLQGLDVPVEPTYLFQFRTQEILRNASAPAIKRPWPGISGSNSGGFIDYGDEPKKDSD